MEGDIMDIRILPALITLIAGAITCIIDIYRRADLLSSLKRLLLVLVIFYILGLIARAIIKKVLKPKLDKDNNKTEDESKDNTNDDDLSTDNQDNTIED